MNRRSFLKTLAGIVPLCAGLKYFGQAAVEKPRIVAETQPGAYSVDLPAEAMGRQAVTVTVGDPPEIVGQFEPVTLRLGNG